MILQLNAEQLALLIMQLSKISKLNDKNKNILISSENGFVELSASSSSIYGQGIIDADIIQSGTSLIPITIIPHLQGFGDKIIYLELTLDNIVIRYNNNDIKLTQFDANINDISKRLYRPEWSGSELGRLKNIQYAAGITAHGLDYYWFVDDYILCSDRYRVAIYKPNNFNTNLSIQTYFTSFLPKDSVDIFIGDEVWFGNDSFNVSVPKVADNPIAKPLSDLAKLEICDGVVVNKQQLQWATDSAYRLTDNQNISTEISINTDIINVKSETNNGSSNINVPVLANELDNKTLKVNTRYLQQAVSNCVGKQVEISINYLYDTPLLTVKDYDVIHFILPMVDK